MITDKKRLDYINNLPTAVCVKQHSTKRGSHTPWTIKISGESISPEFDNFRDAIDWCIKHVPFYMPDKRRKSED